MGADEYTDYGSLLGVSESVNPYIATNSKKMSHHILLLNYNTLISMDICTDSAHKLSKQIFCPHCTHWARPPLTNVFVIM